MHTYVAIQSKDWSEHLGRRLETQDYFQLEDWQYIQYMGHNFVFYLMNTLIVPQQNHTTYYPLDRQTYLKTRVISKARRVFMVPQEDMQLPIQLLYSVEAGCTFLRGGEHVHVRDVL